MAVAREQHQQAEHAQRGQHVGHEVEQRRAVAVGRRQRVAGDHRGRQPQQHEADLGDRRVRQHALDVALRDRHQVAQQQRADRQHDEHLLPVLGQAVERLVQHADRHAEGGQLGRAGNQQRDRRRRAVVDVGHPHVERHRAELEGQAGDDEDHADDQHALVDLAGLDRVEHHVVLQRAGRAVHHRQAVEQEAAGHRAEHEVLHRGFGGVGVVAAQRDQRVQRQAHQLEAEVDDQEVVGRDHHADAQQDEHRQRVELALEQVAAGDVGPGIGQRQHDGQRRAQRQQMAQRVGDHHALHADHALAGQQAVQVQQRDDGQRGLGQPEGRPPARVGDEDVDQRDRAQRGQQHDLRQGHRPVQVVHLGIHAGSLNPAWTTRHARAGASPRPA